MSDIAARRSGELSIAKRTLRKVFNGMGFDVRRLARHESATVQPNSALPEDSTARELRLPKVSVFDILNGDTAIRILEPEQRAGNVSLLEMLVINTLVARLAPSVLFEIGTFDGRTTLNVTANAAANAETFTLDLPPEELGRTAYALDYHDEHYVNKESSGQRFVETGWRKQIIQLFGDSAKFDFTPHFRTVNFVFIDGSHAYDYVKNDSYVALDLVTPPAVIVWHDYEPFWLGVVECLEELQANERAFLGLKHIKETALAFLEIG
jgi:predicted O-methyltransferase YrrM